MSDQLKILFIEDSEDDYILMCRALWKEGVKYPHERAKTLKELTELLPRDVYSLFVVDYHIPGSKIDDVLEALIQFNAEIPIIVVSGTIGEEQVMKTLQFGVRDYVMKDNLRRLPMAIRREIELYRQRLKTAAELDKYSELKRLFKLYADNIDDVISLHDPAGRFMYVSPSVQHVYGYSPDELLGNDGEADIHPDDRHRVKFDAHDLQMNPGKMNTLEWRRRHKNGHFIWLETKSRLLPRGEGRPERILCSTREITQRKRMEFALAGSELRFRNLVQHSTDIFTLLAANGDVLYESPAFYKELGYEESDIIGQNVFTFIHPDDVGYISGVFESQLNKPGSSALYLYRFRHKDGSYRYMESRANNLLMEPNVGAVVINSRNVTERIESEKLINKHTRLIENLSHATIGLIKQNDLKKNLFEFINERITDFAPGSMVIVNRFDDETEELVCESVIGNEPIKILNSPVSSLCTIGGRFKASSEAKKRLLTGNIQEHSRLFDFMEGLFPEDVCNEVQKKSRLVKIYTMGFVREDKLLGNVVIVQFSDSEPINLPILETMINVSSVAIQRSRAEDLIRNSLKEKEVMLKEIHHRVKNNLQIISSLLELQAQQLKDPEMRYIFRDSQTRVKSMALVHERIYRSTDLAHINYKIYLRELLDYLFASYLKPNVSYSIDADEIMMSIDSAVPCGIIINELVSNSLKYAFPDDRPGSIRVSLKCVGDRHEMVVSDDGIGLPDHIDLNNTTSLGLELVNALTQQLNADLQLNRKNGTEFRFMI